MSVLHFMCYCSLSNSFSESCFCALFSSSKTAVPDSVLLSAFVCTLSCSPFVWLTKVHNNHESGLLQILSLKLLPFLLKRTKSLWLSLSLIDKRMAWTFVTDLKGILFIPVSLMRQFWHTLKCILIFYVWGLEEELLYITLMPCNSKWLFVQGCPRGSCLLISTRQGFWHSIFMYEETEAFSRSKEVALVKLEIKHQFG